MYPFIEGILLGLTLAVLFGPALFTLLQTSIHRGFRAGTLIATGIIFSDLAIVMLSYFGFTQLIMNQRNYLFLGLFSGIILIAFGLVTFTRKAGPLGNNNGETEKMPTATTFLLKGFLLNFANPFIWLFWISLTVGISANYDQDKPSILIFFSGALLAIFGTDLAKVMISNRIKRLLTDNLMTWVNRIVGVILCSFGLILIVRVCLNY